MTHNYIYILIKQYMHVGEDISEIGARFTHSRRKYLMIELWLILIPSVSLK